MDTEIIFEDDDFDVRCLSDPECVKGLLADLPAGCLYCQLEEFGYEED